jgi:hypothetical protein
VHRIRVGKLRVQKDGRFRQSPSGGLVLYRDLPGGSGRNVKHWMMLLHKIDGKTLPVPVATAGWAGNRRHLRNSHNVTTVVTVTDIRSWLQP